MQRNMYKDSTSKDSQTDWERINAMQDEEIDLFEIPEINESRLKRAVLRVGGELLLKGFPNSIP